MSISARIRLVLEGSGQSIKDFAERCEIPYSSLQNYLRGEREPKADALISLNAHLGISIDWLLTGQGAMHREKGQISAQTPALSPRETALLTLFNELSERDQREIHTAAEEKKRLNELEKRLARLEEMHGPEGKKLA